MVYNKVIIQSLNSNTRKKLYYESVFCIMNFAFEFEGDLWPNLNSALQGFASA